jgi:hypothetical protein
VTLTSPSATVHTNSRVTVEVAVSGGQAEKVELMVGEQVLASSSTAPYTFTWDTVSSAEGAYVLWARATASEETFHSTPRLAVVDRTPPVLLSQVPAAGELVDESQPTLTLTFSEPLLPSSVQASRIDVGDVRPAVSARLSADGRTLTLQGAADLPRPGRLYAFADSSGLTDLAGNPVGTLRAVDARLVPRWKDQAPVLNVVGGQLQSNGPVLALDASSTAYVSWAEKVSPLSSSRGAYVARLGATSWQQLGGRIGKNGLAMQSAPSLVIDSTGAPLVAFAEWNDAGDDTKSWVYRWNGTSWVNLGGPLDVYPGGLKYTANVALAMLGTAPVLAWVESNGDRHELFVRRWDGATWQALGGALTTGSESVMAGYHAHDLSLIPDARGGLLLAWAMGDESSSESAIHVARYSQGSWERLWPALNARPGSHVESPALAVDAQGSPCVVWLESGDDVRAARWRPGMGWEPLGDQVNEGAAYGVSTPTLVVRNGVPIVAWSQLHIDAVAVQVRSYDPLFRRWIPWMKPLSALPNTPGPSNALDPWLAVDSAGTFLVAFTEHGAFGEGGIRLFKPE